MAYTLKKITTISALIGALLLAGFGCKGLSQEQQAATKPVTLEYWTVFDNVDALQALVAKYKVDRPYLTVNIRQLRAEDFYTELVQDLAVDRGPDIVSINSRSIGTYQPMLAPMPAAARDTTVRVEKGTVSTQTIVNSQTIALPTANQLDQEYVQAVKSDVVRGGAIFGLPLSMDTLAIYYNKDLLDRAGVAEPPKDWEEFQEAIKKITKYDRRNGSIVQAGTALGTGNNIPNNDDLLYMLFKQSGVDFVDRNGRAVFNVAPRDGRGGESPAMKVVSFYADFADPTRDTYSWNETMPNALEGFVNGSVAFFFGYSYHYPIIKARAPQLNFRVMPLLQLNPESPTNVANYSILGVTAKSKHQNEAWALVNYLTRSAATKEYLDKSGRPTAIRGFIKDQQTNEALGPFVSQVLIAENWYRGSNYEAARRAIGDMTHEWLQPIDNPDVVLKRRQEILNRGAEKVNSTL